MTYYHSRVIKLEFDNAIKVVTETLKKEGFGVLSRIDIAEKLKEKLGVDFKKYVILGACNPALAYKALQVEDKIGVMLPCNVIVKEIEPNTVEIAAIDPTASMATIGNPALFPIAEEVGKKLRNAINAIGLQGS
jgi:uncharacterized protein (DUF302 family)